MTKTVLYAPVHTIGGKPALGNASNNPDAAPSLRWRLGGLLDDRLAMSTANLSGSAPNLVGFYGDGDIVLVDQVPTTIAANTIAAAANVVSGVAMTLAGASTGVTVVGSGGVLAVPSLTTIPAGALCLEGTPALKTFGLGFLTGFYDPTTMLSRAVSITGAASATGGNFLVSGYDLFGYAQTELITQTGAATTNGKKTWKWITSVVPQFTDAHNYSVGVADIFGVPIAVDRFAYVSDSFWADVQVLVATFVAADATSPATTTTGDVRGTIAPASASNGTRRLQIVAKPSVARAYAGTIWGVTPV